MIKREIFIGFITGLVSNCLGMLIYIVLFSKYSFDKTIEIALANDYMGYLIALGAILNFVPFFVFLKKKQIYRSRGVLLATILAAICIMIFKIKSF